MQYSFAAVLGTIGLFWVLAGVRALSGMAKLPRLSEVAALPDAACPPVSILVAARDEAAQLPQALPTLLAQDYPEYEVIVVNDRSRDATPEILDAFARQHKKLKVVPVRELAQGWLGKPHAHYTAYEEARGDWLVFTDADVHFRPDLLRRALAVVHKNGWDYLTCLPRLELKGLGEKIFVSYFQLCLDLGQKPWRAADPRSRRYFGVGVFQLVRRAAYEAAGTHRRLALEVADDMKLAKLLKQGGFRTGVAVGGDRVQVRWQEGLSGVIRGLTKNMFGGCDYRLSRVAAYVLGCLASGVLPFLALVWASGPPQFLAGAAAAMAIVVQARSCGALRISPLYALLHPLGALLCSYALLRSTLVTLGRGGIVWRDTFYPLEELRKGVV